MTESASPFFFDQVPSRPSPPPNQTPDTFCIYPGKQFIAKQGFQPASAPELAGLAGDCDGLLTFSDGYSFVVLCMIDKEAHPDKVLARTIDELDDIGQSCLKYTRKLHHTKMVPTFIVLEIGKGRSEDQRKRLELLKHSSKNAIISAMAVDVAAGEVWCNNTFRIGKAPYRSFIEKMLRAPRETDADMARQQIAPVSTSFPVVTAALMAVLCAVFAAEIVYGIGPFTGAFSPTLTTLIAFGGLLKDLVFQEGQWYRLLSAPFLHADAFHLAFNLVALYLAGRSLESLVGRAWFGATYVLGALGGAWLSLLLNPPNIVAVGASGAIMGLFAAIMVTSFRFPPGALRMRMQVNAIYVLIPSLLPLANVLQSSGGLSKVDYGAHFGGALAGTVVGLLLLAIWPNSESQPRFRKIAAAVAIAGLVAAIVPIAPLARNYDAMTFVAQLIPQDQLPKTNQEMRTRASELIVKYPRDPRPHLHRATSLFDARDLAGAEREARAGLAEEDRWRPLLAGQLAETLHLILALAISGDRRQEALAEARQPCLAFKEGPMRKLLDERKLCGP